MNFLIFGAIAYLLGSIPTAVWIGRLKYDIDVRKHGSKNAGATNTFRVLGKKAGVFVLTIDILKGVLAVLIPFLTLSYTWNNDHLIHLKIVSGIFVVIGHIFPVFVGFRGGKGVATSLGVVLGVHPQAAAICIVLFLIVFISSNYVSLGAIVASISFPLLIEFLFKNDNLSLLIFSITLSSAVIALHHRNIKRLIEGNENKMNLFKKNT
ncbi:acyl-phosphate glycerol 3-phosphate acyltransferase [Brumimicrobium salinarum]|uniref:Glycerol-3-phosphate acyltransferase n=1 Tax=Brumimicrobium salinarum TaxID=2058658 RepID=A0A2I0QZI5_9FLAO|nr:glycerol-3-phosphate 1-O-acyltransferase PlsY [Brumimicrobium salinarum]PKR79530.1 acyl-phosphate glycerol 3-phosphate acyltransferase [Brumimicrobium salinarum]